ncbi:hypothetical protein [Streptomyces sp. NPDC006645]|uniref:hypothetical protein n=1 Tax=unclassified Streptomyces TaxID=2593676 RepID=UPI0033A40702
MHSTEDRDQEERGKGWRERLGGLARGALRTTWALTKGAARSHLATYAGLAMMAAGAMMSLTGVGAVAGGPLILAGAAVAMGSTALRRSHQIAQGRAAVEEEAAYRRQPQEMMQQSPPSTQRDLGDPPNQAQTEGRTPGRTAGQTAAPAADMNLDVTAHLARATEALAHVVQALAANEQQRQRQAAAPADQVQDVREVREAREARESQSRPAWDRPTPLVRPTAGATRHGGVRIPMPLTGESLSRRRSGGSISSSSSGGSSSDSYGDYNSDSNAPGPSRNRSSQQRRGKGPSRGM